MKTLIAVGFAVVLIGCGSGDMKSTPTVYDVGRLRWEYHGGPGLKVAYIIRDNKTGCDFLFAQTSGEGAGLVVVPGTCATTAEVAP